MKFFFAILPFILGATSCSDSAAPKSVSTGTVPQPRTVGEFVRAGVRYLEPVYGNHVTPYDSHHGPSHYRPYYGPTVYGRQQFVEVSPSYGPYEPYGAYGYPGYPYPGPQNHYYRPYNPVIYREVVPVNVPGEHVHKGHHFEAVVSPKHHSHQHVVHSGNQHFGQPRQQQYVGDDSVNKKNDEVGVVGNVEHPVSSDGVYRSNGPIVASETVQPSGVVVPIAVVPTVDGEAVDGELVDKSIRKNGQSNGAGNNNKQNLFPFPKNNGKLRPANKLNEAEIQNSSPDVVVATHDGSQVVVENQSAPVTVIGVVPVGVQDNNQGQNVGSQVGNENVPSAGNVNGSPVVAVPVGIMPAVPVASPVMITNEPNAQQAASAVPGNVPVKQA